MPRGTAGLTTAHDVVDTRERLVAAAERWRRCPAIGVDTEFVRERTFYPALGLIQIADARAITLVDTVAIEDLEPLTALLEDPAVTKVLHSCGEDLEVFYHRFAGFPRNVFDTQIAAALAGLGASLGYARLVETLFSVELPKDSTRTNWLRRPLSPAQEDYAALDVAYLLPAWRRLRRDLEESGRDSWLEEELEGLFQVGRFLPPPERAYRRLGAWRSLNPRQLAVLQRLAAWRERQARRRDLPRNFVLREKALVEVARRVPRTLTALREIDSLGRRELERHGRTLLRLVRQATAQPATDLPETRPPIDLTPHRRLIQKLRAQVAETAGALSLPPELLATRKTVEKLLRRVVAGKTPALPRELRGWRRAVIGEALLEILGATARVPVSRIRSSPRG